MLLVLLMLCRLKEHIMQSALAFLQLIISINILSFLLLLLNLPFKYIHIKPSLIIVICISSCIIRETLKMLSKRDSISAYSILRLLIKSQKAKKIGILEIKSKIVKLPKLSLILNQFNILNMMEK